jgi:type III pantothenate kinase
MYLLTIDVGNTHIKMNLLSDKDKEIAGFRLTTKTPRTSDEFGLAIREFLEANSLTKDDIKDVRH